MKTLKVDLGGKLPNGAKSVCIFIDQVHLINGDTVTLGGRFLNYHTLEVTPLHELSEQSNEPWQPWPDDRKVTVEFPVIGVPDGTEAYALVVQPDCEIPAILAIDTGSENLWYGLPKDLKIELLNY